jgi:AhpD family alkylhydroperoxidase
MQARMNNPVMVLPDALKALQAVGTSAKKAGVPSRTLELVHLRASQINGCSFCVEMHAREAPYFTDAERAALALTEAATRLSDRPDPVSDDIWEEAARHYDEPALAALIVAIGLINFWNRINVTTRQVAGKWPG